MDEESTKLYLRKKIKETNEHFVENAELFQSLILSYAGKPETPVTDISPVDVNALLDFYTSTVQLKAYYTVYADLFGDSAMKEWMEVGNESTKQFARGIENLIRKIIQAKQE